MPNADGTILITGARAPVALHSAHLLHGAGRKVMLADTPARPIAAASQACARYHRLPPPR
jgi:NADP-dependent 3-hydroxy acid dehydrogenase YdfG